MEKGFTTQLTKSVTSNPRGFCPTSRMAPKSTFIIMGTIMSQISTAIGILTWLSRPNSIPRSTRTRAGVSLPSANPASMHKPTQTVR
jgi:hypothetical protein